MKHKGFTLVELLIVIVIIGILGSVMFVGITSAIKAAKVSTCEQRLNNINKAILIYRGQNKEKYPTGKGIQFYKDLVKAGLVEGVKSDVADNITDAAKFYVSTFQCPFDQSKTITYRGPKNDLNKPDVKTDQAVIGDDTLESDPSQAFHGSVDGDGCKILTKGGHVRDLKKDANNQADWDSYFNNTERIQ